MIILLLNKLCNLSLKNLAELKIFFEKVRYYDNEVGSPNNGEKNAIFWDK